MSCSTVFSMAADPMGIELFLGLLGAATGGLLAQLL